MSQRKMTVLEIRAVLMKLWHDWEILACNCMDRKQGHASDCTVTLHADRDKQIARAIARLDEIAQKGY